MNLTCQNSQFGTLFFLKLSISLGGDQEDQACLSLTHWAQHLWTAAKTPSAGWQAQWHNTDTGLLILFDHITAANWNRFQGTSINCSLTASGQTVHIHLAWALWFFHLCSHIDGSPCLFCGFFCISIRYLRALISISMMISGIFKATPSMSIPGDFQRLAGEGPDQPDLSLNLSWLR